MILEFSVSNYRSIRQEALLSLVRPSMKTVLPRDGQSWQACTQRVLGLFGPNAAGKSNLLRALDDLSRAVRSPGALLFRPHSDVRSTDCKTSYRVVYVAGEIRYEYEVDAVSWGIAREELYGYPKGARRLLYSRRQDDLELAPVYKFGSSFGGPNAEIQKLTRVRMLFLSVAQQYGHPVLREAAAPVTAGRSLRFLRHDEDTRNSTIQWITRNMAEGTEQWTQLANVVVSMADLGITRVEVEEREIAPEILERVKQLRAFLGQQDESGSHDQTQELSEEELNQFRRSLRFVHCGADGHEFELPLAAQSDGTINWLHIGVRAVEALRAGHVLLLDELDASLHPVLVKALVEAFKDPHLNVSGAQLIFTSHDVSLLGNSPTRLLEPAEVYFVEKSREGASDVFCLDEFDTRAGNNEEKRYLAGRFGALPEVDSTVLYPCIRGE